MLSVAQRQSSFASLQLLEPRRLFAVDLAINGDQTFQTIEGFGTALKWATTSPYDQPDFRKMFWRDLGASFLRVDMNINTLRGSDNNLATPVTMVEDLQTNINQFEFNYLTGGQNFGEVVSAGRSLALDGLKMIGSIWTPPHWMKGVEYTAGGNPTATMPYLTSFGDSSGGSLIDTPENLEQFGRYVAAYVKGFEQEFGVPFYAISIQNELAFHEPYSSAVYYPALYVKAVKAVKQAFTQYGITTKIQGPEDVGMGSPDQLDIGDRTFKYINAVRNDPEAMAAVDIWSTHGVMWQTINGTPNVYRSPIMWDQFLNGRPADLYPAPNWTGVANDGKPVWMTETSGESGSLSSCLRMVAHAFDALIYGNASAWLYWQTAQGSTQTGESLTGGTDTTVMKYNFIKQLFRYVRPGAVRIGTSYSDPYGIYSIAFKHPTDKTVTIVLENQNSADETINLSTLGLNLSQFSVARRTSNTERFVDLGPLTLAGGGTSFVLPARSVVTLQGYLDQQISGNVYNDLDGNGVRDITDPGIARRTIFNDTNGNATLDDGEASAFTDPDGNFVLAGLSDGDYLLRQIIPTGWFETTGGAMSAALIEGNSLAGVSFGSTGPAPVVTSLTFDVNASKPALRAMFSTNVTNSLSPGDISIIDMATGLKPSGTSATLNFYDDGTNARWKIYNLPDGNFSASLPAHRITDNDGTPAANTLSVDFFILAGDANRDRFVDTLDFNILAQNFGRGNKFTQGDFNYDSSINSSDFNLFVAQYGKRLAAPAPVLNTPQPVAMPMFVPPDDYLFSERELLGE
jgi:O-glycosyl hydrolase